VSNDDGTRRPPAASALVVGLERESDERSPSCSVRSATRFVRWLLDRDLCRPDRIMLMTIDQHRDEAQRTELTALADIGVKTEKDFTDTRAAFQGWMDSDSTCVPRPGDEMFYLFWVGHGLAFPNPRDDRVCLLGAEAGPYQWVHIELNQLLHVVGETAPGVHEAAFVSACRDYVWDGGMGRLEDGRVNVSPPRAVPRDDTGALLAEPATREVMCATTQGQSTRQVGFRDQTFADFILEELKDLETSGDPAVFFGDFLDELWRRMRRELGRFPELWSYNYLPRGNSRYHRHLRHEESDATQAELNALTEIAERIDRGQVKKGQSREKLEDLCRVAYCAAVGLQQAVGLAASPGGLKFPRTLEELVAEPRFQRKTSWDKAPGIVIACDIAATLGGSGYGALTRWCRDWGKPRRDLGRDIMKYREKSLQSTREKTSRLRFPGEECLSVLVDDEVAADDIGRPPRPDVSDRSRYYWLSGSLWAYGELAKLPEGWWVTADEIVQKAEDLYNMVAGYKVMPDIEDMLVEFVLPRDLLGRRIEYEGEPKLGIKAPVSVRDLERLRKRGTPGWNTARRKLALIEDMPPKDGSAWADRIKEINCSDLGDLTESEIRRWVNDPEYQALAIWHGYHSKSVNGGHPPVFKELGYAVDAGAAVVLTLHNAWHCKRCLSLADKHPLWKKDDCEMPGRLEDIKNIVDEGGKWNGLRDLPSILKKFRDKKPRDEKENGLQVGVLLEHRKRMDASYLMLRTGARTAPPSGQQSSETRN
jgi:hypothetical protein